MSLLGTFAAASARGFGFLGTSERHWLATLGGAGNESGTGIAIDIERNLYVSGVLDAGGGTYEAIITKYNNLGVLQWQRTLSSAAPNKAFSIAVDGASNVYIAGTSSATALGLIAKYDTSGTLQWQRTLGTVSNTELFGVAATGAGDVYAVGLTVLSGIDRHYLVKYNISGTLQWQRFLSTASNSRGASVTVDAAGDVYTAGTVVISGNSAGLVTKYNSSGTLQWQRTLTGAGTENFNGVATDAASNVYAVGTTDTSGSGAFETLLAKYDTSGTIQWQRTLGGASSDYGYSIAVNSAYEVFVTGYTASAGAGVDDITVAKYDASGNLNWQRTLGSTSTDYGYGVTADTLGNVYVAGVNTLSGVTNILVAKLPGNGSKVGTYTVGGASITYASSSLTAATPTLTSATSAFSSFTTPLTSNVSTLTSATSSFTASVTDI